MRDVEAGLRSLPFVSHLELDVNLDQPVHENGAHLLVDVGLESREVTELGGKRVSEAKTTKGSRCSFTHLRPHVVLWVVNSLHLLVVVVDIASVLGNRLRVALVQAVDVREEVVGLLASLVEEAGERASLRAPR